MHTSGATTGGIHGLAAAVHARLRANTVRAHHAGHATTAVHPMHIGDLHPGHDSRSASESCMPRTNLARRVAVVRHVHERDVDPRSTVGYVHLMHKPPVAPGKTP
jgi:hypothetical protein